MALEMTFKEVCVLLKKGNPKLINQVDKLLNFALLCSPIVLGSAALPLVGLLGVKSEITKMGREVFDWLTRDEVAHLIAAHDRRQLAYILTCYTAFFEAVDILLPKIHKEIDLQAIEKEHIAKKATAQSKKTQGRRLSSKPGGDTCTTFPIPLPHPVDDFDSQMQHLHPLYKQMSEGFGGFIEKLAVWEKADKKKRARITKALETLPDTALKCFEALYVELAHRFQDFYIWSNLLEHKATRRNLADLSDFVQQQAKLAKSAKRTIDIGFTKLAKVVSSIPQQIHAAEAQEVVNGLTRHYLKRIDEQIVEDPYEPENGKPILSFPKISQAFVPQSYRVLRHLSGERELEKEGTWSSLPRREDLGASLLSYLSSPYSTETPLIILGHPGCGKSLLTTVLSARLMSDSYTPIRVPLREVDCETPLESQIEEQINRITGHRVGSWATFANHFKSQPLLIILDGYDELLQASGKVFAGYLKEVQHFQQREADQDRPIRIIVTSRITLIDKAAMPHGATVVRLLEFNKEQRNRWIRVWNKSNIRYFKACVPNVKPFDLPSDENLLALAEQPLLLLMLALYDSEDNKLHTQKGWDRTLLYDRLLRQFIQRQLRKDQRFRDTLTADERTEEIDREMTRIGVAAIGMYNRRKLHILSLELDTDLGFFELGRQIDVQNGRPLSQADLLLGSFFFIHKSQAQTPHTDAGDAHHAVAAFEFLHNTFGEFLTSEFILRHVLNETDFVLAYRQNEMLGGELERRMQNPDGLSKLWFACLSYTPLFTRPVVLEMIREWLTHALKKRGRTKTDFLEYLDEIVRNEIRRLLSQKKLPSMLRADNITPFGEFALVGHLAIYSLNLITLITVLSSKQYVFDESFMEPHEDGSRPWDQLAYIWRSWFSLDNLNGLTAILSAEREGTKVVLRPRQSFQITSASTRLGTVMNVGRTLADNITTGLSGILLFRAGGDGSINLDEVEAHLSVEDIDLTLEVRIRKLRMYLTEGSIGDNELFVEFSNAVELAVRVGQGDALIEIMSMLRECDAQFRLPFGSVRRIEERLLRTMMHSDLSPVAISLLLMQSQVWLEEADSFSPRMLHSNKVISPRMLNEIIVRRPDIAVRFLRLSEQTGTRYLYQSFGKEFYDRLFHSNRIIELLRTRPDAVVYLVDFAQRFGFHLGIEHLSEEVASIMHPRRIVKLAEREPHVAIQYLHLARLLHIQDSDELIDDRVLAHLLNPRRMIEVIDRYPETAQVLVRTVIDLAPFPTKAEFLQHFLESVLRLQLSMHLLDRYPNLLRDIIEAVKRSAPPDFDMDMVLSEELVERFLHPRFIINIVHRSPSAYLHLLSVFDLSSQAGRFYRRLRETIEEVGSELLDSACIRGGDFFLALLRLLRLAGAESIVNRAFGERGMFGLLDYQGWERSRPVQLPFDLPKIPLGSVRDIMWFAETIQDKDLVMEIRKLL